MAWNGVERRKHGRPTLVERRGMVRSALGGLRAPDAMPLAFTELEHPARLTSLDLDNPQGFRQRLVAWLMRQH
ncbi:MAG TPA: hypothetical protein VFM16_05950 [Holophagaceae bacterium]|nr:hypothetical protein [Holophagaceae bacterium]